MTDGSPPNYTFLFIIIIFPHYEHSATNNKKLVSPYCCCSHTLQVCPTLLLLTHPASIVDISANPLLALPLYTCMMGGLTITSFSLLPYPQGETLETAD